jgi:GH25 family lysozyme M1 (1,4-beta-N-acetylmuramidase)
MPGAPVITAVLVLVVIAGSLTAAFPGPAAAATGFAAVCDGVALRAKPSAGAKLLRRIPAGATVSAVARVSGGSWSTTCAGKVSGSTWWRITSVNGTSVKRLYGRDHVYAASGLFGAASSKTLAAQCAGVQLRTSTSTSTTAKVRLGKGTRVGVAGSITGGAWTTSCSGTSLSGAGWWVVTSVNGTSVRRLYGVSMLFAARATLAPPVAATPTPTPKPTPTPSPTPSPTLPPTSSWIEGIDVSHWQGTIDWAAVAASGKEFAFLKASEDVDYADPTYATNRAGAKANGLLAGAYHFARPDAAAGDAVAEADHFIDTAAPVSGELLPVLDLEQTGGLDVTSLRAWAKAFLQRVYERTGVRAAIYVSPSFWSNRMGNSGWFAANGYTVLWIAHWTTGPQPSVPAADWGGRSWTFWQYTSDGRVPGITGRVDLDRYHYQDLTPVLIP